MGETLRNIFAILRGNFVCSFNTFLGRCKFHNIIRVFEKAEIRIDRKAKLILDSGAFIGERCLCTVKEGGLLHIGRNVKLNSDCKIVCHNMVSIGNGTIFGPNILVYDHDHVYDHKTGVRRKEYKASEIVIGNNCSIGEGSIILRGTHIGDNCLVGAGSIVKGDYPAGAKINQKRGGKGAMKIFIATDVNIVISGDRIYANQKHSTILKRYFNAFGKIVLCARFDVADNITKSYEDITNIIDSIVEVGSLYRVFLNKVNPKIETAMRDCDLVICRCQAITAFKAADVARILDKPYLAESMSDPWDAYWNHGIQGKLIAPYMFFKMKEVVRHANYAIYVTSEFLQRRYPCDNKSIAASNVYISEVDNNVLKRRVDKVKSFNKKEIILMTTAAIDVWFKGQQYVIQAIKELNKKGIHVKYFVVGEGKSTYLKSVAEKAGVIDQVRFPGRLSLEDVFELLDTVDIYVQPSLQEGLPRSVIEAMSRGCACIGARTAGIPELIDDFMIVKRKSVKDIVDKITEYCYMPESDRLRISEKNFYEAKQYTSVVLDDRRNEYFLKIIEDINKLDCSGKVVK